MAVDKSVLARWRSLPAADVLPSLAHYAKRDVSYSPLKSPLSSRWHARYGSREFELILTGPKFWDPRAARGGGGAVDLVMYLAQINFTDAVRLLHEKGL